LRLEAWRFASIFRAGFGERAFWTNPTETGSGQSEALLKSFEESRETFPKVSLALGESPGRVADGSAARRRKLSEND